MEGNGQEFSTIAPAHKEHLSPPQYISCRPEGSRTEHEGPHMLTSAAELSTPNSIMVSAEAGISSCMFSRG